jgi:L1 cell adhesion molecule like protein
LLTTLLYLAEDEAAASRIQSKNGLESNAYNLRNLTTNKLTDKFEAGEGKTLQWFNSSQEASKEEYEEASSR